jgi:hypothetical protein
MKILKNISLILILSIIFTSCEEKLYDFTQVTNPNLSEVNVVGQANSSAAWLTGIKRQTALLYNEIVTISEIASDNYVNTQTFYNQLLDNLTIDYQDTDMDQLHFDIARLREMCDFGLEKIIPGDANATTAITAEYHFYKGLSFMLAGEYFSAAPQEENGVPVNFVANFNSALNSFDTALGLNPNDAKFHLAKSRTNYYLGNKAEAVASANASLSIDENLLFDVDFDETNGPVNQMESALFERGTFDDLQPLPSLDFLDPKYSFLSNEEDPSTPILKAEEAHFIIAEAHLSNNSLSSAKSSMKSALLIIRNRPTKIIDDTAEDRTQRNPGTRPNKSSVQVKYEGDTNYKLNLVVDRNTTVITYIISGTSLTDSSIDALSTIDQALEALYLMRQEVFIAEGRRIVDLGVKFVLSENELLLNPNINLGDSSLTGVIPPFIDSIKTELDLFTFDITAGTVDIKHNLNKILVENKTSEFVVPFF